MYDDLPFPCFNPQAFVDEVVNVGELRWLEEWKESRDKKALLTKVPRRHHIVFQISITLLRGADIAVSRALVLSRDASRGMLKPSKSHMSFRSRWRGIGYTACPYAGLTRCARSLLLC